MAWADFEATDYETVVMDLLEGQYKYPISIFCFNPVEGWSRDVSEDIAQEPRRRRDVQLWELPSSIQDFVERHEGNAFKEQLSLKLVQAAAPPLETNNSGTAG